MAPSKLTSIDFTSFTNIVNGEPRNSKTKYHGIDPTTKQPLWDVPVATDEDIEDAVEAANKAYESWRLTTWEQRTEKIAQFKELLEAYQAEMTALLLKETGKPKVFGSGEIASGPIWCDWHIKMKEPTIPNFEDDNKVVVNKYAPLGVAAAICPWNFPFLLSLAKILPAVQMGNAIIVKPSPFTPYTALKLVEIAQQAFPPGLVQVLGGDDKLGPKLVDHPDIQKISFTGSIATGKKVMQAAAKTVKRVTLEMGGNDPCIVLPDADIAKVAPKVALGAFFNSGQVCIDSKRIYIHESIYKPFVEALVGVAKTLKVGDSNEEGVMLGPIQNEMQYEKVKGFFADTKEKGYKFALGADTPEASKGYFIQPTIIDNPPDDAYIVTDEPFGPIVPCQSYSDIDEVIKRANNSKAGLGASVFGTDVAQAQAVAERIDSGSVWVNSYAQAVPQGQFGGFKESGLGTEFGNLGILAYANVKAIHTYKK